MANLAKYGDNPMVDATVRGGQPIESDVGVAMTEFSDAELETIVRQGIERGRFAIEGRLLDAAAVANGENHLRSPDADEPVGSTQ